MNFSIRRLGDLGVGDRFVAHRRGRRPAFEVFVLEAREGHLASARSADGGLHVFLCNYIDTPPLDSAGPTVAWTDPLPEGTDDQAAAWVEAMRGSVPVQLHVVGVRRGGFDAVFAARVRPGAEVEDMEILGDAGLARSREVFSFAVSPFEAEGAATVAPGDMVVAPDVSCEMSGGRPVFRLQRPAVLGNFDDKALDRFLPAPVVPRPGILHSSAPSFPDLGRMLDLLDDAHVRAQPDRALVLNPEDDGDHGPMLIASMGWVFGRGDGIEHFEGSGEPRGLLVLEDVRMRGGEDWLSVDYAARPARDEDLEAFGIPPADIRRILEIEHEWRGDPSTGLAAPAPTP